MSAEPEPRKDPETWIRKVMTHFYPTLIGPTEMWWQILDAVGPVERVYETLDSLSPELKANIRDSFRAMNAGESFHRAAQRGLEDRKRRLVYRFVEWCEREPGEG